MNPTAVVSGVGPGLGAALARKFAQEGCRVGLLARSSKFIQSLADELNQSGQPALAVPTDITDAKQVEHAFEEIRKQLGPVDILINHAGSATWNEFLDLSPEDVEKEVLAHEKAAKYLEGKTPKKVIVVPGRIVNVVV